MADFDYNRPRRPNPETIAYLKSLPYLLSLLRKRSRSFLTNPTKNSLHSWQPPWPLLTKFVMKLLPCGRRRWCTDYRTHGAYFLPYSETAARILMAGLSGYHLHLATHRYGSHRADDFAACSDVVLGRRGVQLHQPERSSARRGRERQKEEKEKQDDSQQITNAGILEMSPAPKSSRFFADKVASIPLDSFWGSDKLGELQKIACHPSAGPLLMVCLRVLTFCYSANTDNWIDSGEKGNNNKLGILKAQPQYELGSPAHDLVKRLLLLNDSKQDKVGEIIYGLSGEPRGSHVLELLMRISPDEIYKIILAKGDFANTLQEYVARCEQLCSANIVLHRSYEGASQLLRSVERLVANGYAIDSRKSRVGIFWRAAELAAKFQVHQEPLLKALSLGTGALMTLDGDVPVLEQGANSSESRRQASPVPLKDCIHPLLNLKAPLKHGDRLTLGVEGTRAIYHLLRFEPKLCGGLLDGLTSMTPDELEMLAKDGLGSRCVWDGILDGPISEKPFQHAACNLLKRLSGRWVALASDRVGHHCVMKLFDALKLDDKAVLTAELAQGSNRLGGSAMGRSIMEACAVNAFLNGENAWKDAVRKLNKGDAWVNDLLVAEPEGKKKRQRNQPQTETAKKSKPSAVDSIIQTITNAVKQ
ncbi:hypothetical protein MHU86_2610 [Fragilaria crotonensis]|nr:hypothetical protein MHU86_2610 [Fragilaria crotonensis]